MCLVGDRTKAHCTGRKALENILNRFNFGERNGAGRVVDKFKLATQRCRIVTLRVNFMGVLLELGKSLLRVDCCNSEMVSGLNRCFSPRCFHW